jgi:aspartokinase/homoserine dehydrogenase 1
MTVATPSNGRDLWAGFAGEYWQVHKFGGTSVANADCFRIVAGIVEDLLSQGGGRDDNNKAAPRQPIRMAVVVSAMGGKPKTTDLLLQAVQLAAARQDVAPLLQRIAAKHEACLADLFGSQGAAAVRLVKIIQQDLQDIGDILKTVSLMKWKAFRISEVVSGYGELWSTQILTALLRQRQPAVEEQHDEYDNMVPAPARQHEFVYLDARRLITVDEDAIQNGIIEWDISQQKLQQVYAEETAKLAIGSQAQIHFVMTGYVASNTNGVTTTLQRDGSDYSAAILGRLLSANGISIWTDVDGVLTADPRRVPLCQVLPEMSYNEAMELAYFGAKVVHAKTMQPAIQANPQIPIYIRNTFKASFPGTRIFTTSTTHQGKVVCGFSSVEDIALINVEGSGLIGVPGVARRLFGTLEHNNVNVILISQASSEHTVTFATATSQADLAKQVLEEEFAKELTLNRISSVEVKSPCSSELHLYCLCEIIYRIALC